MEQLSDPIISAGSVEDIACRLKHMQPDNRKAAYGEVATLESAFMYEVAHLNRVTVKKLIHTKIKQICKQYTKKQRTSNHKTTPSSKR